MGETLVRMKLDHALVPFHLISHFQGSTDKHWVRVNNKQPSGAN